MQKITLTRRAQNILPHSKIGDVLTVGEDVSVRHAKALLAASAAIEYKPAKVKNNKAAKPVKETK